MIAGAVRAPLCRWTTNVLIDATRIRSRYQRSSVSRPICTARTWTNAGQFFLGEDGVACAVPILEEYLRNLPTEVTDAVRR